MKSSPLRTPLPSRRPHTPYHAQAECRVNGSTVGGWPVKLQSNWPATARCWRVPRSKPLKGCSVPWNQETTKARKQWAGQKKKQEKASDYPSSYSQLSFLHSLIVWWMAKLVKTIKAARKRWPAYWHSFHCSSVGVEPTRTGWLGWARPMPILTTASCWTWSQANQYTTQMLIIKGHIFWILLLDNRTSDSLHPVEPRLRNWFQSSCLQLHK